MAKRNLIIQYLNNWMHTLLPVSVNNCDGGYNSSDGNYWASWEFNSTSNMITFRVAARLSEERQEWLAIGMNTVPEMVT